jgi:hypothetical protein
MALGTQFTDFKKRKRKDRKISFLCLVWGTNRMGASRLQQMSHILQVPVEFFFEGAPNASEPHGSGSASSVAQIDDFISNSDGLRLIGAFMRLDNAAVRRRIVMLVQEIAGDDGN